MRVGYYILGFLSFMFWSIPDFIMVAHAHGLVGYRKKIPFEDMGHEDIEEVLEEFFE